MQVRRLSFLMGLVLAAPARASWVGTDGGNDCSCNKVASPGTIGPFPTRPACEEAVRQRKNSACGTTSYCPGEGCSGFDDPSAGTSGNLTGTPFQSLVPDPINGFSGGVNGFGQSNILGPEQGEPTMSPQDSMDNKSRLQEIQERVEPFPSLTNDPIAPTTLVYDQLYKKESDAALASGPRIGSGAPKVMGGGPFDLQGGPPGEQGNLNAKNRSIRDGNVKAIVPEPTPKNNVSADGGVLGKAKGLMTLGIVPNMMDPAGLVNISMSKIGDLGKRMGLKPLSDVAKGGTTAAMVSATGDGKVGLSIGGKVGEDARVDSTFGIQSKGRQVTAVGGAEVEIMGNKVTATMDSKEGPKVETSAIKIGEGVKVMPGESIAGDIKGNKFKMKDGDTTLGAKVLGVGGELTIGKDGSRGAKVSALGNEAELARGTDGRISGKVAASVASVLTLSVEKDKDGQLSAAGELGRDFKIGGIEGKIKTDAKLDIQKINANERMEQTSLQMAEAAQKWMGKAPK